MYFSKIKTLYCIFTLFAFYLTYKCVRSFWRTLYNPTRITNSSATLMNHVYTNDLQNNVKCYILPHDLSDHMAVLFTTNNKALIAPPLKPQVRDTRNFIAEDFLINLQQSFNEKQINFSQSKDINQQLLLLR